MDDSIVAVIVEEARDLLSSLGNTPGEMWDAGPGADPDQVKQAARAAQLIKAGASLASLDAVRDLCVLLECVLEMVREKKLELSGHEVEAVSGAFQALESMLADTRGIREADAKGDALAALLKKHVPGNRQEAIARTVSLGPSGEALVAVNELLLLLAKDRGDFLYLVEYGRDLGGRGSRTPMELFGFLEKSGRILGCRAKDSATAGQDIEPGGDGGFYVLFASILEPDMAKAIFQVESRYIHPLDPNADLGGGDCAEPVSEPDSQPLPLGGVPVTKEDVDEMERLFDLALAKEKESGAVAEPGGREREEPAPVAYHTEVKKVEGFEIHSNGSEGMLVLEGALTVERSSALRLALLDVLNSHESLILDMGGVDEIDLAGFQVLLSAVKTGSQKGVQLSFLGGRPDSLLNVAARAGFDQDAAQRFGLAGVLSD